mgnify:CR=1 FL=1
MFAHTRHYPHACATSDRNHCYEVNFDVELMEFWASTFKFSSELAKMRSKMPNLIQNTVALAELKFQLLLKSKKLLSENCIFGWPFMTEYTSDVDEMWKVKEVNACSFKGV